jgi:tRNA(Arg) A34 adenosine deaminase TadA
LGSIVVMIDNTSRHTLASGAWAALEGAFTALIAGGLPCGAALVDPTGTVIARGRNHAYDARTGDDIIEETPLAHAELNVLARVPTSRDLTHDTLWSTQQPCAMCAAAIAFCGVGHVRFLAADPAFIATDDVRGGALIDPTSEYPELTVWAIVANALFLRPTIVRGDSLRLERNRSAEPETVEAAEMIARQPRRNDLAEMVDAMWNALLVLANRRVERLRAQHVSP